MADITATGVSGYGSGSIDSATVLVNGVTPRRAQHVNGPASAAVQIETILGSGTTLKGSMSDLATRLSVALNADGTIKLNGFTGLTVDRGLMAVTSSQLQLINHTPIGVMFEYGGASAPPSWLLCDGTAVNRTTYAKLFAVIGTTFGVGDGATTFNVPDRRGRMAIMLDGAANRVTSASTNGANANTLGGVGGNEHLPQHSHTLQTGSSLAAGGTAAPGSGAITQTLTSSNSGTAGVTGVMNPWLAVNIIIFTGI